MKTWSSEGFPDSKQQRGRRTGGLDVAKEADLIVMATEGRLGFIDAVRGSVTEQAVRGAPCSVLTVSAS